MKRVILFFLFLALSIWLGLKIYEDPGQVIFVYKDWTLQTTLWFGAFALLVLFLVVFLFLFLLNGLFSFPKKAILTISRYKNKKSEQLMEKGFFFLLNDFNSLAEKYLNRAAKREKAYFINTALAAIAADKQKKISARNVYLKKIEEKNKNNYKAEAALLLKAKLDLRNENFDSAKTILIPFCENNPQNFYAFKLLTTLLEKTKNWEALRKILPSLRKNIFFKKEKLEELELDIYANLLKQIPFKENALEKIKLFWESIPKKFYLKKEILLPYVKGLKQLGDLENAEKVIVHAIKKTNDRELIACYGSIKSHAMKKQIAYMESWLKKNENDFNFLFYLGKLYSKHKLWGKAQEYLKKSLHLNANQPKAWFELAYVSCQLGLDGEALKLYQKGIECLE